MGQTSKCMLTKKSDQSWLGFYGAVGVPSSCNAETDTLTIVVDMVCQSSPSRGCFFFYHDFFL